jgi:hypothetical protein
MKIKVSELTQIQIDYLVAILQYPHLVWGDSIGLHWASNQIVIPELKEPECYYNPSSDWSIAGKIIHKEKIHLLHSDDYKENSKWIASIARENMVGWRILHHGETPVIAAMRSYIESKLGDTVEIPEDLV